MSVQPTEQTTAAHFANPARRGLEVVIANEVDPPTLALNVVPLLSPEARKARAISMAQHPSQQLPRISPELAKSKHNILENQPKQAKLASTEKTAPANPTTLLRVIQGQGRN